MSGETPPADPDERGSVAVTDLAVDRGDARVLDGVVLRAHPGELLGVVGPNGAGKTTLLRAVNGTLSPASGTVTVAGDDVTALGARERGRRVATVPQRTTLSFEFTVREAVAMGRHPHRSRLALRDDDGERVAAAMARTGVARFADRPVTAVSGGERQRVLLARAVAQDAPVTLLDEPTASLDVAHAVRTLSLASDLADDGHTVVAAIHDLNLAARFCDRLALLADGRVRRVGAPADVLDPDVLGDAFGGPVSVTRDPATGSPLVTALPPVDGPGEDGSPGDAGAEDGETAGGTGTARPHRGARVHVVGGDGAAAPLLAP
ncbi:MAG: ABC transporter ATP-binding protein, partial [Halobacteriaceae archaeon]